MIKIVTIVGARPQFIKAATVSRAIREHNKKVIKQKSLFQFREENESRETPNAYQKPLINEIIVHTGQHYDAAMSEVFFKQLEIPEPDFNLGISSLSHGAMTGRMLEEIEKVLLDVKPDWVLVYGDTNSTLAGALAAAKLHIPIVHVEAGLRSHFPEMPEEQNRILTDRVSTLLCCPTQTAVDQLAKEGFPYAVPGKRNQLIVLTGDVMADAVAFYREKAKQEVSLDQWGLTEKNYVVCTLHRAENTDVLTNLEGVFKALQQLRLETAVVLPLHPRTKQVILNAKKTDWLNGIKVIDPLPYLEMQRLLMSASLILTDSGGIQKEAYLHQVPCITLRNRTEWVETVESGWNVLAGVDCDQIVRSYYDMYDNTTSWSENHYGNGNSAKEIINVVIQD